MISHVRYNICDIIFDLQLEKSLLDQKQQQALAEIQKKEIERMDEIRKREQERILEVSLSSCTALVPVILKSLVITWTLDDTNTYDVCQIV